MQMSDQRPTLRKPGPTLKKHSANVEETLGQR